MTLDKIKEAISELLLKPVLVYRPSLVSIHPTESMRAVLLSEDGDGRVRVKINADGICLDAITESIQSMLGDDADSVVFDHLEPIKEKPRSTKK